MCPDVASARGLHAQNAPEIKWDTLANVQPVRDADNHPAAGELTCVDIVSLFCGSPNEVRGLAEGVLIHGDDFFVAEDVEGGL
jgi:hypothetical protein